MAALRYLILIGLPIFTYSQANDIRETTIRSNYHRSRTTRLPFDRIHKPYILSVDTIDRVHCHIQTHAVTATDITFQYPGDLHPMHALVDVCHIWFAYTANPWQELPRSTNSSAAITAPLRHHDRPVRQNADLIVNFLHDATDVEEFDVRSIGVPTGHNSIVLPLKTKIKMKICHHDAQPRENCTLNIDLTWQYPLATVLTEALFYSEAGCFQATHSFERGKTLADPTTMGIIMTEAAQSLFLCPLMIRLQFHDTITDRPLPLLFYHAMGTLNSPLHPDGVTMYLRRAEWTLWMAMAGGILTHNPQLCWRDLGNAMAFAGLMSPFVTIFMGLFALMSRRRCLLRRGH
jgi:hypothetical protein